MRSSDSSLTVVSKLRRERSKFDSQQGEDTSLRYCVHLGSWTHTAFYPVGSEGSFSADKPCDSEHSHPSSVKVNMWRYTIASPYVFIMQCSMKHSDEFTSLHLRVRWDLMSSTTDSYILPVCMHRIGRNWDLSSDTNGTTSRLSVSNFEYEERYC